MNMQNTWNTLDWIYLVLGIVAIGMGIKEIITKELTGRKNVEFTPESQKAFAPIDGACNILVGVGAIVMSLSSTLGVIPKWGIFVGIAMAIAALVIDGILAKKRLVPKNPMKGFKK